MLNGKKIKYNPAYTHYGFGLGNGLNSKIIDEGKKK
jgi:hypothetical protein